MLLITAFIHTSQLAFPPTGNRECHAFWTVKVVQYQLHLHLRAAVTALTARRAAGGGWTARMPPKRPERISQVCACN